MFKVLFFFTAILYYLPVEAKSFRLNYLGYPKHAGNCWESAEILKKEFQSTTQIFDAQVICKDENDFGYTLELSFNVQEDWKLVSTYLHHTIIDRPISYSTYAACISDLETQKDLFLKSTGLRPFVSYCISNDPTYSPASFSLRIEGIGQPYANFYSSGTYLFGKIFGHSAKSFLNEIEKMFLAQDVTLAKIQNTSSLGFSYLSVYYYSSAKVAINHYGSPRFKTLDQCQQEKLALDLSLLDGPMKNVLSYCAQPQVGFNYELQLMWLGEKILVEIPSGEYFADYSTCSSSRQGMVDEFSKKLGLNLFAGICTRYDQSRFTMVFLKNDI